MTVRTRFSPSPTGMIHLGNARTALFCALFATKNQGVFVLRIEDTDAIRSEERFVDAMIIDLKWLGIHWQEGPLMDGPFAPYWQSQRQSIYEHYYQILEEQKQIYPCFCTDQELNLARKLQLSRGQAPRYGRTCRKLSQEEIEMKIKNGLKPAWRFLVPPHQDIQYVDTVKGPQHFQSDDIGDFIVRRADGTPPFLFCNAIDDATMDITHVLRGEDHVANTPRQILLLQTLGLSIPDYGHLSLIVGEDGAPLSKRHGSFSLNEMHKHGYLPLALLNYFARLGHTCDSLELLNYNELAEHFYLEKLSRSPARFDSHQLLFWQKSAVQSLTISEFWQWVGEEVVNIVPDEMQEIFAKSVIANVVFPSDALMWARILFTDNLNISISDKSIIQDAGEQFFVEAEQAIYKYGADIQQILNEMKQSLGLSGKKLFMPLRLALTGKINGPELVHIGEMLGKEKMQQRISYVFQLIKGPSH